MASFSRQIHWGQTLLLGLCACCGGCGANRDAVQEPDAAPPGSGGTGAAAAGPSAPPSDSRPPSLSSAATATPLSATPETKLAIEAVMRADRALADLETYSEILAALEQLDAAGCPPEFQRAFDAHRKAWRRLVELDERTDAYRDTGDEKKYDADGTALTRLSMRQYLQVHIADTQAEINSTYAEMTTIAERWGVEPDQD